MIEILGTVLLLVLLGIIVIPILIYVSVKVGVVGYYSGHKRGQELFGVSNLVKRSNSHAE